MYVLRETRFFMCWDVWFVCSYAIFRKAHLPVPEGMFTEDEGVGVEEEVSVEELLNTMRSMVKLREISARELRLGDTIG